MHRGYAFITYSNVEDAEDAIDNMHMNEWYGVSVLVSQTERSHSECRQSPKDYCERLTTPYLGNRCTCPTLTPGVATRAQYRRSGRYASHGLIL